MGILGVEIIRYMVVCNLQDIDNLLPFYQIQSIISSNSLIWNKRNGVLTSVKFVVRHDEFSTVWNMLNKVYDVTDCTEFGLVRKQQIH